MRRRVCLILPGDKRREQLWNKDAQQTAKRLGMQCHLSPPPRSVLPGQWPEVIGQVDAIVTSWLAPRLTADVLPCTDRLKVVAHAAGSVEPIVSADLFDRGIRLLSANRYMANSVAQWSLMMTLAGLFKFAEFAQVGCQSRSSPSNNIPAAVAIDQATIGIWGCGDVARQLIRLLQCAGAHRIVVHSDVLLQDQADELGVEKISFDEMFVISDVVHLCEALREDSFEQVTKKQLTTMKQHAVLINAGRAKLVRETDLLEALQQQKIYGILDVHHTEPLPADSPFGQLANVIHTPHVAGSAGRDRYVSLMLEQIDRVLNGQDCDYEISPQRAARMTSNSLVTKSVCV